MKKALLAALATGAIFAATAAAATAGGTLTGAATFSPAASIAIGPANPVVDGGSTDLENDTIGGCTGDTGVVGFSIFGTPLLVVPVLCAHHVASSHGFNPGSPKMRFAFQVPAPFLTYIVVKVTDNGVGGDTMFAGIATSQANAIDWVNKGQQGSGSVPWTQFVFTSGDFTVSP